jgi:hypothetical protein
VSSTTSAQRPSGLAARLSARRTTLSLETLLVLGVCAIAVVQRIMAVGGIATDYDEGVYWQSLRAMAHGAPLFSAIFSSQPPLFLLSVYPFYVVFGQSLAAARIGIAFYSLVGLAVAYLAGRAIAGRWAGLGACVLLAADPLYLRESHTLQAEAPAVAFELLAVWLAVITIRRSGQARLAFAGLSGVAIGLGMMIKLVDVVALVPAVIYLLAPGWATCTDGTVRPLRLRADVVLTALRRAMPALLALTAGLVLAIAAVVVPFAGSFAQLYDQVVRFHLVAAHAAGTTLRQNVHLLVDDGYEYPVLAVVLVALWLAYRRRAWVIAPPALLLLASYLLLLRQQPLFDHHVVLLAPALALTGALALPLAAQPAPSPSRPAGISLRIVWGLTTALVLVATLLGLGLGAMDERQTLAPLSETQVQMASALQAASVAGAPVVTDDQYIAGLADRSVPPELVDTSEVRIVSGYLTAAQLEGIITRSDTRVILFASGRFDLVPGFRAWVAANFTPVATFGDGRTLYLKLAKGPPVA